MDTIIILLIVNVFAAVAVIALTLIQQPKGDMGSAFGGGGSQSMFGSRGSANFLTKSTSWMCFVFFASSLVLAYLYAQGNKEESVVEQSVIEEVSELPSIVGASSDSTDASAADTSAEIPSIPVQESTEAAATEEAETQIESVIDTAVDAADIVDEAAGESNQ